MTRVRIPSKGAHPYFSVLWTRARSTQNRRTDIFVSMTMTPIFHFMSDPLSIIVRQISGLISLARATAAAALLLLTSFAAGAQIAIGHDLVQPLRPDSVDSVAYYSKKHFWRASAEVVGFNLGLWAFDRYVQKGDFAYISWNSIKENFRHGFIWDNDNLGTNTFSHPYNGSIFFNAARANGYNFWQSELFAIGGSAMWELFMECEYPSTNDIIATPIGGAALGEILFRSADAILDDRATGWNRAGREIAAFVVSPMNGINRIVTGQAWRRSSTSGKIFGHPRLSIRLSAGIKFLELQGRLGDMATGFDTEIDVEYGDRFRNLDVQRPYDYFTVHAELQAMKGQPVLNQLEIKGRLLGKELLKDRDTHASVGLYQHFDFYDSDTIDRLQRVPFKLGIPACVGGGVIFRDIQRGSHRFNAFLHTGAVLLGSVLSDHYTSDNRNYNWAQGFSVKLGANFVFANKKIALSLYNNFYRLFTWKGYRKGTDLATSDYRTLNVMGDKSDSYFNVTDARLDIRLKNRLFLTVAFSNYFRFTHYRDFSDVRSSTMALRFLLSYRL